MRLPILRTASICAVAVFTSQASAQMAVTTFGATDAAACFENAGNDFSRETGPCDIALRQESISRADRKKTLVNRGIIHNRNGDLQPAADDFNAALGIDKNLAEAYLNRGNTYFFAGQSDTAIDDYKRALDLDVSKPWAAWYNIGLAYDAKKEPVNARRAYEEALALKPSFTLAQTKLDRAQ